MITNVLIGERQREKRQKKRRGGDHGNTDWGDPLENGARNSGRHQQLKKTRKWILFSEPPKGTSMANTLTLVQWNRF